MANKDKRRKRLWRLERLRRKRLRKALKRRGSKGWRTALPKWSSS